eukprot:2364678-Rhodomonas_salina.1
MMPRAWHSWVSSSTGRSRASFEVMWSKTARYLPCSVMRVEATCALLELKARCAVSALAMAWHIDRKIRAKPAPTAWHLCLIIFLTLA